jgi:NAD-reducing hydrogenase large subunit
MADSKTLTINPVTRIEGHAKITIRLGSDGKPADAQFHVNEFRGFERFCEGRMFTEMPVITPRICGICPVSHTVASLKACEDIMRVTPPPAAEMQRKLLHFGQLISSHALSFFHLSSPDMLLGWDSDPATRNILGVAGKFPELAVKGIRLRKFGQEISERLTGKKLHTAGLIPGGVANPVRAEDRDALLAWIPEAMETTQAGLKLFKDFMSKNKAEMDAFASFPSLYFGLVGPAGEHETYGGRIRVLDNDGVVLADQLNPRNYLEYVAERPVDFSYLKFPYYKPKGFPGGFYRVGPLARLNISSKMRTPLAQKEFGEFKQLNGGKPVQGSFYYHQARLIETLTCIEQVRDILSDPELLSKDIQSRASRNQAEGVGCSEAPRGTLFHHYVTDENGVLTRVNLLIATGQNNPAMNQGILQVAKKYVDGKDVKEGALNRVEGVIRCYDPCLSCSTHAAGTMPISLEILGPDGARLATFRRG